MITGKINHQGAKRVHESHEKITKATKCSIWVIDQSGNENTCTMKKLFATILLMFFVARLFEGTPVQQTARQVGFVENKGLFCDQS